MIQDPKCPHGPELLKAMQNAEPQSDLQANVLLLEGKLLCPNGHEDVVTAHLDLCLSNVWTPRGMGTKPIHTSGLNQHSVQDHVVAECGYCLTCGTTWMWPESTFTPVRKWPSDKKMNRGVNDKGQTIAVCDCGAPLFYHYTEGRVASITMKDGEWDHYSDMDFYSEGDTLVVCNKCNINWISDSIPELQP
jgi:hypothetical protein